MIKKLFALFCFLGCTQTFAQSSGDHAIDSMLHVLPTLKEDSNKVKYIVMMSQQYYYSSRLNEGIVYLKEGLSLAEKLNWKKGIAKCNNNLGLFISDTGNNVQARIYFEKALKINEEITAKADIINNLNNIGRSYQHEADFSNAVKYFFNALKVAEEIKSYEKMALVGTNITATYFMQEDYEKAEKYAEMTLENAKIARTPFHIGKALQQLGEIYLIKKDTAKAAEYFTKAKETYRAAGILQGEIEAMSKISNLEKPEEALKTQLEIQNKLESDGSLVLIKINNLSDIGTTYFELAKSKFDTAKSEYLKNAEKYLKKGLALADETQNTASVAELLTQLSGVEEDMGNYKYALALNKEYHSINDSIFSQESKNKIAAFESKKTVDLKDKEIQINKLAISNQQKTQIGLIAGLCLLGIIGALLLWQNKTRKKTNSTLMVLNTRLDEANKLKAKFFAILSHDLRSPISNLVNFLHLQKESPELLTAEETAANQQIITNSADNLLETMEAMLLWSKGQMQNFKPQIKMVSVSSLFDHLQQFFSGNENIAIHYNQPAGLMVSTDENYLQTIMHNLTSNAIKALQNTPGGTIQWLAQQNGNKILLSITDNGPGVKDEQVTALNDDADVVNAKTGFGLHIIRDLAKAIQCSVSMQSSAVKGTTFVLSV